MLLVCIVTAVPDVMPIMEFHKLHSHRTKHTNSTESSRSPSRKRCVKIDAKDRGWDTFKSQPDSACYEAL